MRLRTISVLFLFIAVAAGFAQSSKPLTNDDVIKMEKLGFADQTIIGAIKVNGANFDTSIQGLIALKTAGVSQPVIDAMLSAEQLRQTSVQPSKQPVRPTAAAASQSGVSATSLLQQASDFERQANAAAVKAQAFEQKAQSSTSGPLAGIFATKYSIQAKLWRDKEIDYHRQAQQLRAQVTATGSAPQGDHSGGISQSRPTPADADTNQANGTNRTEPPTDANAPICDSIANCQQSGDALLTQGRNLESFASWDKIMQLGGAVLFNACSDHLVGCDRAVLRLSTVAVSLQRQDSGAMVFSAPPSQVSTFRAQQRAGASGPSLGIRIAGESYSLEFFSLSGQCDVHPFIQCPSAIAGGQQTIAFYVADRLRQLTRGAQPHNLAVASPRPSGLNGTDQLAAKRDTVVIEGDNGLIQVADFYEYSKGTDDYGGIILEKTSKYVISYNKQARCTYASQHDGCFSIDLVNDWGKADQLRAERSLATMLAVSTRSVFCKLPISVSFVEDAVTGVKAGFPPSVCPGGFNSHGK
ncbi:MAG TPA: hypothetical protein VMU57_01595 [Edaphobacter sp.]|uniref:hypothetical protein n=1 Tax=Edaphobacter sp. TaxID=1934404 RepID=UPI002BD85F69|nr:hypothetical protein [Edaphobacter sp.]HUZ93586.1 hypothetical protein [Edaphobacter sp.]